MKAGLKPDISEDENEDDEDIGKMKSYPVKEDKSWTIAVTRDRRIEKESLKDYINKKREMFLVQVSWIDHSFFKWFLIWASIWIR